jgi:hypothetical protein
MMFSLFIFSNHALIYRPSGKGFGFTEQGLSAGGIEGTTHVDFGSHMIRK